MSGLARPRDRRLRASGRPAFLPLEEIDRLLSLALASAGIDSGHVAVEFVSAERIAELNAEHRGKAGPTDVLSFPIDGEDPSPGPRELGDIVICPEHTATCARRSSTARCT